MIVYRYLAKFNSRIELKLDLLLVFILISRTKYKEKASCNNGDGINPRHTQAPTARSAALRRYTTGYEGPE